MSHVSFISHPHALRPLPVWMTSALVFAILAVVLLIVIILVWQMQRAKKKRRDLEMLLPPMEKKYKRDISKALDGHAIPLALFPEHVRQMKVSHFF